MRLLSVLFSSMPLTPSVSMTLYQAARQLLQEDGVLQAVAGDTLSGSVKNLRRHVALGSLTGPSFEAHLDTEKGAAVVRYLLTREATEGIHPAALRN